MFAVNLIVYRGRAWGCYIAADLILQHKQNCSMNVLHTRPPIKLHQRDNGVRIFQLLNRLMAKYTIACNFKVAEDAKAFSSLA